ncbi:uncharacterized protein C3orf14 homolog isoform X2 [Erpetoichthys calabaricus]|nr:uncharacterized protein C3orf14 homolog isoform X2 [Erpetoichthys calabaricus]
MESHKKNQNEENQQKMTSEASHARNLALLKDLQMLEERLHQNIIAPPPPHFISLKAKYMKSVEESLPQQEQSLSDKAESPSESKEGGGKPKSRRSSPRKSKTSSHGRPPSARNCDTL